ncbi:Lrp/AsnC family transcriptional regulator [Streptomyces lomondensis]|uniref:Transcriptional regulator n=1 Tax=Streptomyces lomondensis TaxID=68229 RepID=A0A0E3Z5X2_9ACTN|nr:AsnC family transcriptional regulator [Streptomyces lomondensis]AKC91603.1 transcriptional regulator [Streptomyces lomondensis]MCF0079953.1 AsnC family transcriptional regulator [Streptomyces lomondensis]GGW97203.1 AsnC family transcriptional regulator [Streptomyces lomondensis]
MLDGLDRALIHALHIDGRASFTQLATVLAVSPQTVSRRYERLREQAALRVVGLPDHQLTGHEQWLLRLTADPETALDLAHALVRRPDTSWVYLTGGGTEIVAVLETPLGTAHGHSLLLHELPPSVGLTAVSAHHLLHSYLGWRTPWRMSANALTPQQQRMLCGTRFTGYGGTPTPDRYRQMQLSPADHALMDALRRDGRAAVAELAADTGWSPATVSRRLDHLRACGAIFFDIEIDPALLGGSVKVLLWMVVAPARLDEVAASLARHDELAFVAHTTGPTNLVAHALCRDTAALYHYLTHGLGTVKAISSLETAPVLRTLKAVGPSPSAGPPSRRG